MRVLLATVFTIQYIYIYIYIYHIITSSTNFCFHLVISFSFERPSYTVAESDGTLNNTIVVRKSILTELDYSFNVSLRSGDVPATEGNVYIQFYQQ